MGGIILTLGKQNWGVDGVELVYNRQSNRIPLNWLIA
ncbi:hypothetical protein SAMN05421877_10153 [Sphingobacterium lactis]|uniref:Uncharacterized protein n=1 Tax=Sphingobacterium lactis TaxID=797291 RepID=A0A1H5RSG0_9SPHI|nr:hypothetical protein SAMN05421877_10153 [Sphingobacterium lactis]